MVAKNDGDYSGWLSAAPTASSPPITFVLHSLNRSGGSRVTVEMANRLIRRGYLVRIAVHDRRAQSLASVKEPLRKLYLGVRGRDYHDWGQAFLGRPQRFSLLDDLNYAPGEIVIAVGTNAIDHVQRLSRDVTKLRFCHGFAEDRPETTRRVWSGPIPTLSVASTLVPRLRELGAPVVGVVHNGIDMEEYYDEHAERAWVGFMYSTHYNKAPEHAQKLVETLRQRWPAIRFHSFGEASRPSWLLPDEYMQYPSVPQARALYNKSKIWLVISRMEGLPGPVLEAMACGCAVVSTNNVGSRELIRDGENGVLLPIGDIDGFANVVGRLLFDTDLRDRLAQAGHRTARTYTWERAVDQMEDVLRSIIRTRRTATVNEAIEDDGMRLDT